MTRQTVALLLLNGGTVALAFVIGANLFEQLIFMPGWHTPHGLEAWRELTKERNAGYFFLPLAVSSLLLLAGGTAVGWKQSAARDPFALGATLAVLVALIMTASYIVPRAYQLFAGVPAPSPSEAARLLEQFRISNALRVLVSSGGLVSALFALRR